MIVKNTSIILPCYCCLNVQGEKKVVNTEFEADFEEGQLCVIVTTRCQACGKLSSQRFSHIGGGPLVNGEGYQIKGYSSL